MQNMTRSRAIYWFADIIGQIGWPDIVVSALMFSDNYIKTIVLSPEKMLRLVIKNGLSAKCVQQKVACFFFF